MAFINYPDEIFRNNSGRKRNNYGEQLLRDFTLKNKTGSNKRPINIEKVVRFSISKKKEV